MTDVVVYGVSHVDVPVVDLSRAAAIYQRVLGFPEKARGDGFIDLDAGGTCLRLFESPRPAQRAALRVLSATVDATLAALRDAGCQHLYEVTRTPALEVMGAVHDPDGNTIYVWRALTEDEYGFTPELPKEMTWSPEAEELLKSLLKRVPVLFRSLARGRVVATVEELAAGTNLVTRQEVIRGFILASPRATRGRNRQPLIDHGIDPDLYRADWDAD